MAAKKKPTAAKAGSDTPNKRMARAAAGEAIAKYVDSPTNRAQVINPRNYPEGSDGYYMKTAGRFRAGTQIADKVYKETLDRLNKTIPSGSKPVPKSTSKPQAKKLPVPKKPLNPSGTKPFNVQPKKYN